MKTPSAVLVLALTLLAAACSLPTVEQVRDLEGRFLRLADTVDEAADTLAAHEVNRASREELESLAGAVRDLGGQVGQTADGLDVARAAANEAKAAAVAFASSSLTATEGGLGAILTALVLNWYRSGSRRRELDLLFRPPPPAAATPAGPGSG